MNACCRGVLIGIALTGLFGCEKAMTDAEQDAAICDPAFLRDKQWDNLASGTPMAKTLQKQFSSGTNPPRWYVRAKTNEYGSCTRDTCPDGRCHWHVSIFKEENGAWAAHMEYDLAPKKVR